MTQEQLRKERMVIKSMKSILLSTNPIGEQKTIMRAEINLRARQYNKGKSWFNKEIKRV